MLSRLRRVDPVLAAALAVAAICCLHGNSWGYYESWHSDQLAFRNLFSVPGMPLHPANFLKPPLYTYFAGAFSVLPFWVLDQVLDPDPETLARVRLIWTRMLTAMLFLALIGLTYIVTRNWFGRFAARVVTLLLATSAGFVAFSHLLTTDLPLTTAVLATLFCAQRVQLQGRARDYLIAGACIGLTGQISSSFTTRVG